MAVPPGVFDKELLLVGQAVQLLVLIGGDAAVGGDFQRGSLLRVCKLGKQLIKQDLFERFLEDRGGIGIDEDKVKARGFLHWAPSFQNINMAMHSKKVPCGPMRR